MGWESAEKRGSCRLSASNVGALTGNTVFWEALKYVSLLSQESAHGC
jgi:hypothetical protein